MQSLYIIRNCSGLYSASSTSLEHRLVQAARGCAPSVESLAIFDVKQTECGTLLGWVTVQPSE